MATPFLLVKLPRPAGGVRHNHLSARLRKFPISRAAAIKFTLRRCVKRDFRTIGTSPFSAATVALRDKWRPDLLTPGQLPTHHDEGPYSSAYR